MGGFFFSKQKFWREFQILLEVNKFVKASCAILVKVFCEYNFERTSIIGDPPF